MEPVGRRIEGFDRHTWVVHITGPAALVMVVTARVRLLHSAAITEHTRLRGSVTAVNTCKLLCAYTTTCKQTIDTHNTNYLSVNQEFIVGGFSPTTKYELSLTAGMMSIMCSICDSRGPFLSLRQYQ